MVGSLVHWFGRQDAWLMQLQARLYTVRRTRVAALGERWSAACAPGASCRTRPAALSAGCTPPRPQPAPVPAAAAGGGARARARAHAQVCVAAHDGLRVRTWDLELAKGARGRPGEEAVAAALALRALAAACGVPADVREAAPLGLLPVAAGADAGAERVQARLPPLRPPSAAGSRAARGLCRGRGPLC